MEIEHPAFSAVHVFVSCKDGDSDLFLEQSRLNASNSVLESGIARFDVLQNQDDPKKFVLIEVYKDDDSPGLHKQTEHYNTWRNNVANSMEQPRQAKKYNTLFPTSGYWRTDSSATKDTTIPEEDAMLSVLVDVQVKPGAEEAFIQACIANATCSQTEAGVSKFDLVQNKEDPCNFVLHEVYNCANGPAAHKATPHYQLWRDTVESMMERPRQSQKYRTRFPSRVHWHMAEAVAQAPSMVISPPQTNPFEFVSADRIVFGRNSSATLPDILTKLGAQKVLVVTGRTGQERYAELLGKVSEAGMIVTPFIIDKEPGTIELAAGQELAFKVEAQAVVGLGGGSVIDGAKAIAALATNPGEVYDYMEVVGKGQPISVQPLPFIAMPTTAGTGSEVTKNAVINSEQHNRKVSIRSPMMLPTVALIDPLLGVGAPPQVTAYSGLDCLTQCIEPYVSCKANPFTDGFTREGILRASRSLRAAYRDGNNLDAREDMAVAAVLGGLSLANAKLGAVHGFAGYVGGKYPSAPHGAVCAALLPHVFRMNAEVLSQKAQEDPQYHRSYLRHIEVAKIITGNPNATVEEGAQWLESLTIDLQVPSLATFGMVSDDFVEVSEQSAKSSSMQGNPVVLTTEQLVKILEKAAM